MIPLGGLRGSFAWGFVRDGLSLCVRRAAKCVAASLDGPFTRRPATAAKRLDLALGRQGTRAVGPVRGCSNFQDPWAVGRVQKQK